MIETPATSFEPGRVPAAPPANYGTPAPPVKRKPMSSRLLALLLLAGALAFAVVLFLIGIQSGGGESETFAPARTQSVERWICKSMLLEYQSVERGYRDEYNAMRRWGEWMRQGESDPAIVFRYYSNRERSLFWEWMRTPDVTAATFAGDALIQHCLSAEVTAVATATATAIFDNPTRTRSRTPSPCDLMLRALEETGGDAEEAAVAWVLALKGIDPGVLTFRDDEERRLYRGVRDAPIGDETGGATLALGNYCEQALGDGLR